MKAAFRVIIMFVHRPKASHALRDAKSVGLLLLFNYQVGIFASVLCDRAQSCLMLFSFQVMGQGTPGFALDSP